MPLGFCAPYICGPQLTHAIGLFRFSETFGCSVDNILDVKSFYLMIPLSDLVSMMAAHLPIDQLKHLSFEKDVLLQ